MGKQDRLRDNLERVMGVVLALNAVFYILGLAL
jgi:hypothetical protein